jgi:hypothetical protein
LTSPRSVGRPTISHANGENSTRRSRRRTGRRISSSEPRLRRVGSRTGRAACTRRRLPKSHRWHHGRVPGGPTPPSSPCSAQHRAPVTAHGALSRPRAERVPR